MLLLAIITKFILSFDKIQLYIGTEVSKLKEIFIEIIIDQLIWLGFNFLCWVLIL